MAVVVFGSANVDISVGVQTLPRLGETKHGSDYRISLGGKGLNQAVAASRLSKSSVQFIGAVGTDHFGSLVETKLMDLGVATSGIRRDPRSPTGLALIHVDGDGNNSITVSGGANLSWTTSDISELTFDGAVVGLCQLETPLDVTIEVMKKISDADGLTILDPAPIPEKDLNDIFEVADILTPNQFELAWLTGSTARTRADLLVAARSLIARGPRTVLVTSAAVEDTPEDAIDVVAVESSRAVRVRVPKLPIVGRGTGDAIAALFLAHILAGRDLAAATSRAASSLHGVLRATVAAGRQEMALIAAQEQLIAPDPLFPAEPFA